MGVMVSGERKKGEGFRVGGEEQQYEFLPYSLVLRIR